MFRLLHAIFVYSVLLPQLCAIIASPKLIFGLCNTGGALCTLLKTGQTQQNEMEEKTIQDEDKRSTTNCSPSSREFPRFFKGRSLDDGTQKDALQIYIGLFEVNFGHCRAGKEA